MNRANIKSLPDLNNKRIRVKEDIKTFNPHIRGNCFEVKEVAWDSNDLRTRKPIVRIQHERYEGYTWSWLSLDKIEVKGE